MAAQSNLGVRKEPSEVRLTDRRTDVNQTRPSVMWCSGSGMGLATAETFADEGAAVAVVDINESAVRTIAQRLPAAGCRAIAVGCGAR